MAPRPVLFYRDEYVYDVLEAGMRHTFDVEKPRRIRNGLLESGVARESDFREPAAVTVADLALVHTPDYIEQIQRPETLARLLFLDPTHPWDEKLLMPFLYASGGTVAGARHVAERGGVALNLGGGYHHAQSDKAEGFCAIADTAIAIRIAQREHGIERVLVVDLDYHHGNGNAEIFSDDESVFTFSMHANNWCWIRKQNNLDIELPSGTGDEVYLQRLRDNLPRVLESFAPDMAVYVAGSDPFVEDALGDFQVSEAGMLERDRTVTEELRRRQVPFVAVTAGGYGPKSWTVHYNYYRWLLEAGGGE